MLAPTMILPGCEEDSQRKLGNEDLFPSLGSFPSGLIMVERPKSRSRYSVTEYSIHRMEVSFWTFR